MEKHREEEDDDEEVFEDEEEEELSPLFSPHGIKGRRPQSAAVTIPHQAAMPPRCLLLRTESLSLESPELSPVLPHRGLRKSVSMENPSRFATLRGGKHQALSRTLSVDTPSPVNSPSHHAYAPPENRLGRSVRRSISDSGLSVCCLSTWLKFKVTTEFDEWTYIVCAL